MLAKRIIPTVLTKGRTMVKGVGFAADRVIGATLQLYDQGRSLARGRTCCAGSDIDDARRAAADHDYIVRICHREFLQ